MEERQLMSATQTFYCLSVRQPFASLIAYGLKDVDNRSWTTEYRGYLKIHASYKPASNIAPVYNKCILHLLDILGLNCITQLPRGGIVGMAKLILCSRLISSPYAMPEKNKLLFIKAKPLPFVACRGKSGIFTLGG